MLKELVASSQQDFASYDFMTAGLSSASALVRLLADSAGGFLQLLTEQNKGHRRELLHNLLG